jgi:tetratricopeptide (TPR) repeat protein
MLFLSAEPAEARLPPGARVFRLARRTELSYKQHRELIEACMAQHPKARCQVCAAPVPFSPGAGSRLCPFCDTINLVREQALATPPLELRADEVFRLLQQGKPQPALEAAERLLQPGIESVRLSFYRACALFQLGRLQESAYALIDLTGLEAPAPLRADIQALLAEVLIGAGRLEEAALACRRAEDLLPGHPQARLQHARLLEKKGQIEEAAGILEQVLKTLDQPWKISLPPSSHRILLLLSEFQAAAGHPERARKTLETLLVQATSAPLPTVVKACASLARILADDMKKLDAALLLLRHAVLLDPENRLGLIEDLKRVVAQAGGDAAEEARSFQSAREELMREVREALLRQHPALEEHVSSLEPSFALGELSPDPDRRTDILEGAALRLGLKRFDRGTLYPLGTLEEFRRWAASWRLRDAVSRMNAEIMERNRRQNLQEMASRRPTPALSVPVVLGPTRRRRRGWLLFLLAGVLLLAGAFLALVGERFLDRFEGRLVAVECAGQGPPCSLIVAGGPAAIERFRQRQNPSNWFSGQWSTWLDRRVRADGTIEYPLSFPWGNIPADRYRPCVDRPVKKLLFTLAPLCDARP